MWVPLVTAGIGAMSAEEDRKAQASQAKAQRRVRAAEVEASPWTKMAPQTGYAAGPGTSSGGAMLKGAVGGFAGGVGMTGGQGFGFGNSGDGMGAGKGSPWAGLGNEYKPGGMMSPKPGGSLSTNYGKQWGVA